MQDNDIRMIFAAKGVLSERVIEMTYATFRKETQGQVELSEWLKHNLIDHDALLVFTTIPIVFNKMTYYGIEQYEDKLQTAKQFFLEYIHYYEEFCTCTIGNREEFLSRCMPVFESWLSSTKPKRYDTQLSKLLFAFYLDYISTPTYSAPVSILCDNGTLYDGPADKVPNIITSKHWEVISVDTKDSLHRIIKVK